MKLLKILAICIIGFGLTGIACQKRGAKVSGRVDFATKLSEYVPAAGVSITVSNADDAQYTFTGISDANGKYSVRGIQPEGDYTITVDFTNATNKPEGFNPGEGEKNEKIGIMYEINTITSDGYILRFEPEYFYADSDKNIYSDKDISFTLIASDFPY